jgi:predicted GIY-YIG superfamily endonuclease
MLLSEKTSMSRDLNARGFIYRITNLYDGKVYIGLTTRTPAERWRGHQRDAKRGRTSRLHQAIRLFGRELFLVENLKEATVAELPELERKEIKAHSSDNPELGYNACPGGGLGGPTFGHEVSLNGVRFVSRKTFADHLGLNYELVRKMFSEGKSPEEIAKEGKRRSGTGSQLCKAVVVNGVEYASVQVACDTLGVARANVNYRLRKGWSLDEAFSAVTFTRRTTLSAKPIEFNGVTYASLGEIAEEYGVPDTTLRRRVTSLGWTLDRAVSTEKFTRKGVKNRSKEAAC